jgi:hypothetical protein
MKRENIIFVAVIVIFILIIFLSMFNCCPNPLIPPLSFEYAFGSGCIVLRSNYTCSLEDVDKITILNYKESANDPKAGQHTLLELCTKKGLTNLSACAKACGCII